MSRASYYLTCSDCGKSVGATKKRLEKWQIRLQDNINAYLCRKCRKKHPKQIGVTIPDNAVTPLKEEQKVIAEQVNAVYNIQILKKLEW